MIDIELKLTVEFTTTMIIRCNVIKNKPKARALALELHEIIRLFRRFYSVRPPYDNELLEEIMPHLEEIEGTDLVLKIWRTAFDIYPKTESMALLEGEWLDYQFERIGADELCERYRRLCDKINGTKFADEYRKPNTN